MSKRVTSYHISLCVRGALMNWELRQFRGMFRRDDGTEMTPREAKSALMDELIAGHEVLPYGDCDNWDWKQGCQGHREGEPCAVSAPPATPEASSRVLGSTPAADQRQPSTESATTAMDARATTDPEKLAGK